MAWSGNEAAKYKPIVIAEYGSICHLCLKLIESDAEFSIDHVIPRSKGGDDSIENLRPAHRKCNYSRGAMDIESFQQRVSDDLQFFQSLDP